MPKKTYEVTLPDGTTQTLSTQSNFEFVVIGRLNLRRERISLEKENKQDKHLFWRAENIVAAGTGGFANGSPIPTPEDVLEYAHEITSKYRTAEEFEAAQRESRLALHDWRYGDAHYGEWEVLGWAKNRSKAALMVEDRELTHDDVAKISITASEKGA
jgi:hypothetical protein